MKCGSCRISVDSAYATDTAQQLNKRLMKGEARPKRPHESHSNNRGNFDCHGVVHYEFPPTAQRVNKNYY